METRLCVEIIHTDYDCNTSTSPPPEQQTNALPKPASGKWGDVMAQVGNLEAKKHTGNNFLLSAQSLLRAQMMSQE